MNQNLDFDNNIDNKYEIIKLRERKKIKIPLDYYNAKLMEITRKTFYEFPWAHIQTVTYGNKRIGKSIYYIKSMMEQQRILHPDWDKKRAFKEVMNRTYFTLEGFITDMKKLEDRNQDIGKHILDSTYVVSCHVDDAGCGFNKYKWFTKRKLVEKLKEVIDTIGTLVNGLYFSSPTLKGMLGFIKEYESSRIHITSKRSRTHRWDRMAKIYYWHELPSGTMRIKPYPHIDEDPFSCFLEDEFFNAYWYIRQSYLHNSFEELDKIEKELESKGKYDKDLHNTIEFISDRLDYASETGM